ncbi:class I SAM-dependent methyltransferase [Methylosinus sp. Ce-a6]|uniref:class I SAM-dependent methyltransferase n=1 Tax=Methylosinus sp. Ce-a6 TaxID=2172005 RepID=UPI0034D687D3
MWRQPLFPDCRSGVQRVVVRRQGSDVRIGAYEDLPAEENVYDTITGSHVIEHVHEPNSLLRFVNWVSKQGGIVSIETSNIDSLGAV